MDLSKYVGKHVRILFPGYAMYGKLEEVVGSFLLIGKIASAEKDGFMDYIRELAETEPSDNFDIYTIAPEHVVAITDISERIESTTESEKIRFGMKRIPTEGRV